MSGRLIAVVGPSGVGKDTLMRALAEADPSLVLVRRVITRDADLGGEDFEAADPATFARRRAAGEFALDWQAHGLCYGIPATVRDRLEAGETLMVNLSRRVIAEAAERFAGLSVLNVTARPETLAARLRGRGRESEGEISGRLARDCPAMPDGVPILTVANDGPLRLAVAEALAALYPVRA